MSTTNNKTSSKKTALDKVEQGWCFTNFDGSGIDKKFNYLYVAFNFFEVPEDEADAFFLTGADGRTDDQKQVRFDSLHAGKIFNYVLTRRDHSSIMYY